MRGILEFILPEETQDFEDATKAQHYIGVIEELDNYLRQKIKYAPEGAPESETDIYQEIRTKLHELKSGD